MWDRIFLLVLCVQLCFSDGKEIENKRQVTEIACDHEAKKGEIESELPLKKLLPEATFIWLK